MGILCISGNARTINLMLNDWLLTPAKSPCLKLTISLLPTCIFGIYGETTTWEDLKVSLIVGRKSFTCQGRYGGFYSCDLCSVPFLVKDVAKLVR